MKQSNVPLQSVHQTKAQQSIMNNQSTQKSNIPPIQTIYQTQAKQSNMNNYPSSAMAHNSIQQTRANQSNMIAASNQQVIVQQSNAYKQSAQQSRIPNYAQSNIIKRPNNVNDGFPTSSNIGQNIANTTLPINPFA